MPLALEQPRAPGPVIGATSIPPVRETDLDRILKLIPTELLAFYAAAVPIIGEVAWSYFSFVLFVVGTSLCPLVLYLDGRSTGQPAVWQQYVIRTLAFVAWAIAIAWPFGPWASEHELRWVRSLGVVVVPFAGALLLRPKAP